MKTKKQDTAHGTMPAIMRLWRNPWMSFLLGTILGVLFFIGFYGTKVLDPTYTAWLLSGEDLNQHFLGWEFYRSEPWTVPLGMIHQLAYPFGISVTFMDSIPLLAIPFKLFNSILPEQFQYFGMWGLFCFGMQGGLAALLIRRYSSNILVTLLGSVLFIVSPMMIARMFSHTALAGHWIILLAILALFERRRIAKLWQFLVVWSGLFMLAGAVHPYFLPMVALPFVITVILTHVSWLRTCITLIVPPVIGAVFFWLIGGLVVTGGAAEGLGDYALNLDSLYNPLGYSAFIDAMPIASVSGETLNYLGLGMLLLVAVAAILFTYQHRSVEQIKTLVAKCKWRYILVVICTIGLIIVAISPRVQWGVKILADIEIPSKIERLWAMFRASGRLFWPVYYLIVIGTIGYVVRSLRGKKAAVFLVVVLAVATVIQTIDIVGSPNVRDKHSRFVAVNQGVSHDSSSLNRWQAVVSDKKHIVYLGDLSAEDFFALSNVALKYHLTMNNGYFARSPKENIARYQAEQKALLTAGTADTSQNIYVTKDMTTVAQMTAAGRTATVVDGYYVVN